MIPIEKLKAVTHIVSHEHCPDGVGSAMVLKDVLPNARVTFCNYNTATFKNLVAEPGMLFCDFSPPRERFHEFVEAGAICLDHHKTQKDIVEAFGPLGVFGDEVLEPGVCGTSLAYREVWLPLASREFAEGMPEPYAKFVEDFARLSGIRDTWQRQDPDWFKACHLAEALTFWPEKDLVGLPPAQWASKLALGEMLYNRRLKHAKRAADNGYYFTSGKKVRAVVFEGVRASSDAAEYLGDKVDLVIGFATHAEEGRPAVQFSTRSHTYFDCAAFAKSFPGGGGHTKAAGFTFEPPDMLNYLSRSLEEQAITARYMRHPFLLAQTLLEEYEARQ